MRLKYALLKAFNEALVLGSQVNIILGSQVKVHLGLFMKRLLGTSIKRLVNNLLVIAKALDSRLSRYFTLFYHQLI